MGRARAALVPAAIAAALFLLLLPASAAAARPLATGVDPDGPFYGELGTIASQHVKAAGADNIRLLVNWREVAPATPPPGFDPSNPGDPAYDWSGFEAELLPAVAAGLQPIVVIRSAPAWAESAGDGRPGTNRPDPAQFARFGTALARRYSGSFAGLPRIRRFQAWNEPNHFGFLNPQFEGTALVSVSTYAGLVNAFADAVHAVHADNIVIAGGLAPFQNPSPAVSPPLRFLRDLLCMSGGARPKPTCQTALRFDAWTHHPYTAGGPTHKAANVDDASIPELAQMGRTLRAAQKAGHIQTHGRVRFYVTEFAWDTNPPDPGAVPLTLHARWTAEALYRMWKAGVSLVTWYKLRDDEPKGRPNPAVFQCGLYFRCTSLACDKPKPSMRAFRFPVVAFRSDRRVFVWGRTPHGKRARVTVQQRAGSRWRRLRVLKTDRFGIFERRIRTRRKGGLRAVMRDGSDFSVKFSLRVPPDISVNPFG
jgi:hypothetical protein